MESPGNRGYRRKVRRERWCTDAQTQKSRELFVMVSLVDLTQLEKTIIARTDRNYPT